MAADEKLVLVVRARAGPAHPDASADGAEPPPEVGGAPAPDRPERTALRRRAVGPLLPVVAWTFGAAVFFRNQLTSGFDKIMGNDGDTRLIVLLHEHWWAWLGGHQAWNDPGYFHPAKDVLGYSDTFALNMLLYAPLRAAGLDPFLAFQWTLVGMSAIGFGSLYIVLRRHLRVHPAVAAGGGLLYCFANNLFVKGGHPQVLTSWWTPVCVLAGVVAARHPDARVRVPAAAACGALAALIVYSSFYVGWTALMAAVVMASAVAVVRVRAVVGFCRSHWRELVAAITGAGVGSIPFLLTYLPVLAEKGGRTYAETRRDAPKPWDLVNVSYTNWLWGSALTEHYGGGDGRIDNGELMVAVTPVLALGTAVLAIVVTAGRARLRRARRGDPEALRADGGLAFARLAIGAAILLAVLPLDFDGWSLWRPIWENVPGASALRATARMQIVVGQLMAVAFAICLSRLIDLAPMRRRWRPVALRVTAAALLGLVLVEQLNLAQWSSILDRSEQLSRFRAIPAPPPACTSFFVTSSGPLVPEYVLQIDAMLMANSLRIPTVNGYSGQTPDGWMLAQPQDPAHLDHVRRWVESNRTAAGLCRYDEATRTWDTSPLG